MKIENPLRTYVAYEIEYLDDCGLVDWAIEYLPISENLSDDPDLIDLVAINTKDNREVEKAGPYFTRFVSRQWPEFNLKGSKAESDAKQFFHRRMQEYLEGKCRPYDVCKMIWSIEDLYDFPKWLGDMYNACDWVEPETLSADCKYLEEEIERALKL